MRIIVEESTICTYSYHSPEQYGDWEEQLSYCIGNVHQVDEDYKTRYGEEGYRIPDDSEHAYVIHMIYDSGDSFGRSYGNGAILGVFGNRHVAEKAFEDIQAQKEEYTFKIKDDAGEEISIYNPGAGYFEYISSINLESYPVGGSTVKKKVTF